PSHPAIQGRSFFTEQPGRLGPGLLPGRWGSLQDRGPIACPNQPAEISAEAEPGQPEEWIAVFHRLRPRLEGFPLSVIRAQSRQARRINPPVDPVPSPGDR